MIVETLNYLQVVDELKKASILYVDTETTGLNAFQGDDLFSIIIGNEENTYYFNFNDIPDHLGFFPPEKNVLDNYAPLIDLFNNESTTVVFHNAKFDMHMLAKKGINIKGPVFCTEVGARIIRNDLLNYRLESLAPLIGLQKDDAVKKYVLEHKLFDLVKYPGKKKTDKNFKYYLVPFRIISKYASTDVDITRALYKHIIKRLKEYDYAEGSTRSMDLYAHESKFTKVLYDMERTGVKIDREYVEENKELYLIKQKELYKKFKKDHGVEYQDSPKVFNPLFKKYKLTPGKTETGRPSYKEEILSKIDHKLAKDIQEIRSLEKTLGTYILNFLSLSDSDDIIHCDFKQAGTATGRLSCKRPNMQNVPKESGEVFIARKAFIPRKGYKLLMLDYDQMEYRLMLDYAGEIELINQVLNGLDVHTATADMINASRTIAKKINFLLLYGGGPSLLASELNLSLKEATAQIDNYFKKLPKVSTLIKSIKQVAKSRGYITNWLGRRYHFKSNTSYIAPNHLIQGGSNEIVKKAMIHIYDYLKENNLKTRLLLQVHDEIILELHESEENIIPVIKNIMESAYKHTYLGLTCGVDISSKSWGEKVKYEETRN